MIDETQTIIQYYQRYRFLFFEEKFIGHNLNSFRVLIFFCKIKFKLTYTGLKNRIYFLKWSSPKLTTNEISRTKKKANNSQTAAATAWTRLLGWSGEPPGPVSIEKFDTWLFWIK